MLKKYLDDNLGKGQSSNKDTIYPCPFCKRRKLYVITDHSDNNFGVYHCFRCGASGSLIKLIATIKDISYLDAKLLLPSIDKYAVDETNVAVQEATPEESLLAVILKKNQQGESATDNKSVDLTKIAIPDKIPPKLPVGLKYISDNDNNQEAEPFINYLYSRGFTWQDIVYNKIGYIVNGGAISVNKTFFPIYNHVVFFAFDKEGHYQYWNTRAIYPSTPKSINAPEIEEHLGKGDVVYNLYPALSTDMLVLVEGVPDAMTLGINGIATYGKQVTDIQKALIINNIKPSQMLILMLDMDAWDTMADLATELYKYHENTYLVYNPTRQDANSLGKNDAWRIINDNLYKATPKGIIGFKLLANSY